ncbi:MAG: tail fiber domain-containing protein, partial [Bacteroidetes bacterium]|nr:tail fiber domain-containing protein [Bacteroidota bacterium]
YESKTSGLTLLTLGSSGSGGYIQSWQGAPLYINSQGNNVLFSGTGNIGIGTASPTARLHLKGTTATNAVFFLEPGEWNSAGDYARILFGDGNHYIHGEHSVGMTFFDGNRFRFDYGNVGMGRDPSANKLEVEGDASKTTAGDWLANSDKRIKTDIRDITGACQTIMSLRPVKFRYTDQWAKEHPSIEDRFYYNFIAQEYRNVFPESVKGSGEYLEGDKDEILQIDTYNAQIVAISAIQELIRNNGAQQELIESQQKEIGQLKAEMENVKNLLQSLAER